MHEWVGHIVACKGAEQAAARVAAGISQQFLCGTDGAEDVWALIDAESIGRGTLCPATFHPANFDPTSGITFIDAEPVIEAIAGAIPGFGLFD
jgi:hypothetical protein